MRRCEADIDEEIWQQLGAVQQQHAVEDVPPAVPQDVSMTMGQAKHRPRCQLRLHVVPKHHCHVVRRLQQFKVTALELVAFYIGYCRIILFFHPCPPAHLPASSDDVG